MKRIAVIIFLFVSGNFLFAQQKVPVKLAGEDKTSLKADSLRVQNKNANPELVKNQSRAAIADSLRREHSRSDSVSVEHPDNMRVKKDTPQPNMPVVKPPSSNEKMPVKEMSDTSKHK